MNKKKSTSFIKINLESAEYDSIFAGAHYYEKYGTVEARPAKAGEKIITLVSTPSGTIKETKNKAGEGDFIVTNPGGEQYIIKGEKFSTLYKKLPAGKFKPLGKVKAVQSGKNVVFTAPWGEKMKILAGGYLVDNKGDRYGIEENVFAQTYKLKE